MARESIGIEFEALASAEELFGELRQAVGRAATDALRETSADAKKALRKRIRATFSDGKRRGPGQDLANSFRVHDWPNPRTGRFSYSPAADVVANPSWAHIYEDGGAITPSKGGFLAFATEAGEDLGLDWGMTDSKPSYWAHFAQTEKAESRFGPLFVIQPDDGDRFLAADHERVYGTPGDPVALFHLRQWVPVRKRVHFHATIETAAKLLPDHFDTALARATR